MINDKKYNVPVVSNLNPVMIHQGQEILCEVNIGNGDNLLFVAGKYYKSRQNNCLVAEDNQEYFIPMNKLFAFILKDPNVK